MYGFDNRIYALLAPFRNACLLRWNPANRTPLNNRTTNVDAKIYVLTRQSLVLAADDTALVWGSGADMIEKTSRSSHINIPTTPHAISPPRMFSLSRAVR